MEGQKKRRLEGQKKKDAGKVYFTLLIKTFQKGSFLTSGQILEHFTNEIRDSSFKNDLTYLLFFQKIYSKQF